MKNLFSSKWYIVFATALLLLRAFYWELLPTALTYGALLLGFCMLAFVCIKAIPRDAAFYKPTTCWLMFASYIFLNSTFSGVFDGRIICMLFSVASIALFAAVAHHSDAVFTTIIVMLTVFAISTLFFYVFPQTYTVYVDFMTTVNPAFLTDTLRGYRSGLTSHYSYNGWLTGLGFILSACKLMQRDASRLYRIIWLGISAFFMAALMLTSKRSMLLYGIVSIVGTYLMFGGEKRIKHTLIMLPVGVIGLSLAALLIPGIAYSLERLLGTLSASSLDGASSGRIQLWDAALKGWLESPIFGQGWGTYEYHWPNSEVVSTLAHNDVLHVLYSLGFVGLIPFIFCLAICTLEAKKAYELLNTINNNDFHQIVAICCCIQFYCVLYGLTVGTLLVHPYVFQPFFCAVGIIHGIVYFQEHKESGCPLIVHASDDDSVSVQ